MANMQDIAQIVDVISAAYPNFNPTPYTVEVYWQTLKDLDAQELRVAVLQCISESGRKFAPSVGEIRGTIVELRGIASNVPVSYRAWQEVLEQFLITGYYGTPQFSHPLIEQTVRALGWRELCTSENQVSDRARFIECYEQFAARAMREETMLPEVRGYLEVNGAKLMAPLDQIKQLADKKNVRNDKALPRGER